MAKAEVTALLLLVFAALGVHDIISNNGGFLVSADYTGADNNNKCPQFCQCLDDDSNGKVAVDCSRSRLTRPPLTSNATTSLNLAGNSLGPIIEVNFPRMRNLTELDLSYNGLRRLLGCTFKGLMALKRLSLRGNRMTSLPDSLFTDTHGLERLDLSHNLFGVLPDAPLRHTPGLKWLDLSHNKAVELKLGPRFQVPRHLEYLDLSHNLFETMATDAFHMANQWEIGIKRTLKVSHCRLASIEADALTDIPHLNDLDLSGNPNVPAENLTAAIKELEQRMFERLSLTSMNLTDISSFFTQVTLLALKFLNVSDNNIASLPSGMFSTVSSIRVLDASQNALTSLDKGIKDLVNLRVLNLSRNALTSFKGQAVNSLNQLEDLDVSHNRLESVSRVNFRPLIKLQQMRVSNNFLPSVVLPQTTNNLIELDYSSNSVRQFGGFMSVHKLERFDISNNDLEKIEEFLFKQARFMKVANFSHNSITELDPNAFLPQSPLVIDLSHNFLTMTQFSNWIATQELYINHNWIHDVRMQTFHRMTGLRVLDMSENNITALHEDLLDHTGDIERLNLSHNSLSQNHFSLLFRNLRNLEVLDLSGNTITSLNESMLEPLPSLRRLFLAENHLQVIMPRVFRDLRHLQEIDLSDNPFSCVCDMLALRDWLSRMPVPVMGLYAQNSSSYVCRGPGSRVGMHLTKWEPDKFECDEVMLYMIVFGSIGLTLIVAGIVSTIVHRLYRRHQRKKEEALSKRKTQLDISHVLSDFKKSGKKSGLKGMTSEEIAEEITNAIERRERRSMRKAEERERKGNGYVSWPAGKKEAGEKTSSKKDQRPDNIKDDEGRGRKEKTREKAVDSRHFDHLAGRDRDPRDQKDHGRDSHGNEGAKERGKRDRGREYVDIDKDRLVRLQQGDRSLPEPRTYWLRQNREYPPRLDRDHHHHQTYRAEPIMYHGDQYAPRGSGRSPPRLPPRNRWDAVEVWDRDARGWVMPGGHRRSRSQGHRREREDQRYMTMPIREQDLPYHHHHRARSQGEHHESSMGRSGGPVPTMHLDRYTNEVRFGIEDLNRYGPPPDQQHRSRRDLYDSSQRSKSYHQLPSEYRAVEDGRVSPGRTHKARYTDREERRYWADDVKGTGIGPRAASQPFLVNENTSDWL